MKKVIIACEMLRYELEAAIEKTGSTIPVQWVKEGLHSWPDKLRTELQGHIDRLEQEYDTILLGYGLCGNAMVGLRSEKARIIAARFDDCIRILMSVKYGEVPQVDCHCLYATKKFTESDLGIPHGLEKACEKYGKEKAERLYRRMLNNYTGIRMIDSDTYDVAECEPEVQALADRLRLEYSVQNGSNRVLEKLLTGPWDDDDDFYIVEPGTAFEQIPFLRAGQSGDLMPCIAF